VILQKTVLKLENLPKQTYYFYQKTRLNKPGFFVLKN